MSWIAGRITLLRINLIICADLYRLYRYVHSGVRSLGGGYRFQHLKRQYPIEYAELKVERDSEYYEHSAKCS